MSAEPTLSVVVPTLEEADRLPDLLSDLSGLRGETRPHDGPFAEIVVVDGGSNDATAELARRAGARVVEVSPGRGRQLRTGAKVATGDWLFFIHADCRLSSHAVAALRGFLANAREDDFAHFAFELERSDPVHRFIEFGQRLRERWLGLVYGDQGLVVSRSLYERVAGYPEWSVMEDVEMIRRLEAAGRRVTLPATLVTSSRRYDEEGGLRRWMRNVVVMGLFRMGVDPERLGRWYRARRPRTRRMVGVFAKAPAPGTVKTRLAADVGHLRAAEIYRVLGRATVDELRGGSYRLVVFFAPPEPEAREAVRDWLDPDGIELRPQRGDDLGSRMAAALEEALGEAEEAVLVGSDIPGIDDATVAEAFGALRDHDVVLGPATDGGYYLVGLARPHPGLFADIPWSTERVLSETLRRADERGLSVALLSSKTDVDTVGDLPPDLSTGAGIKA